MTRARDLGDFIADGAAAELVVDTTTLVVDSTNNRVGIGTASPSQALEVTGTAKLATVDIDAGAIDGAVIGANSAAAGTFTALTASGTTTITTADINGGAIDGAIIGANSAAAVTATTLNASTKLQVNSTDVITNARQLSNIASIDATTAAAITAGGVGGGGSIELTASGSITAGDLVGIEPSGSVSKLQPANTRNSIRLHDSDRNYIDAAYIGSNKVILAYRESSSELRGVIGTISGNSVSYGTAVQINADVGGGSYCDLAYDSNTGNAIFVWTATSDKLYARAVSISGTTITVSSDSSTNIASNAATYSPSIEFDPDAQRALLIYRENNAFQYSLLSLGGTGNRTITIQTDSQTISGNPRGDWFKMAYDTTEDKMLIVFRNAATGYLHYICADIGSSSVTFGTMITTDANSDAGSNYNFDITFVPTLNKTAVAFKTGYNILKIAHLSLSGTTITKTETTLLDHSNVNDYTNIEIAAQSDGKCVICYTDTDSSLPDKIRGIIGSFSGTTFVPSLSDFTIRGVDDPLEVFAGYNRFFYTDSTNDKFFLMTYVTPSDGDTSTNGYYSFLIPSADGLLAFDNWIGISSQSVSDGASVNVTVQGGLNENQSSLDVGRKYYLQDNATITTAFKENRLIGVSTAANKLFLTNGSILIGPTGYNAN